MNNLLILKIIFILIIKSDNYPLNYEISNSSLMPLNLENLEPSKFEYLKYVNNYLNLKSNRKDSKNLDEPVDLDVGQTKELNETIHNSTINLIRTNLTNQLVGQMTAKDKLVLFFWTLKDVIKSRIQNLEDNNYLKKIYLKASELNKEDFCIPFMGGLIFGFLFLIVLNLIKKIIRRFCPRRYTVNRIKGYKNSLLNKRNPLDETHHLLIHHNLSDIEI